MIPSWEYANLPNFLDLKTLPTALEPNLPKLKIQNPTLKDPSVFLTLEPDLPTSKIRHPKSPFRLLFLSRLHQKKGVELLFETLTKVPFDWTLTIAGDGETDYLAQLKKLIIIVQ